jgi:hypothetical protein
MKDIGKDLRDLAATIQQMAGEALEQDQQLIPIFMLRDNSGRIFRLPFPKEAGPLMNIPEAKDMLFEYIRMMVKRDGLTAVVFATEAWIWKITTKGDLSEAEVHKLVREKGYQKLLEEGLAERSEAILITVQTAEAALIRQWEFFTNEDRTKITFGECGDKEIPQKNFVGRQKMFGDLSDENIT